MCLRRPQNWDSLANTVFDGTLGYFVAMARHFRQTAARVPALQAPQMAFFAEVCARQAYYQGPFTAPLPMVHGMAPPGAAVWRKTNAAPCTSVGHRMRMLPRREFRVGFLCLWVTGSSGFGGFAGEEAICKKHAVGARVWREMSIFAWLLV